MDLVLTEEKTRELWSEPSFGKLIQGCKHVVVSLSPTTGLKHLAVVPTSIAFIAYNIDLGEDMSRSLVKVVDIVTLPEPDPPERLPEVAE